MIIDRKENTSIITQENTTVIELVKKIEALYPKFKNDNIIVVLTSLERIPNKDIEAFIPISNVHRMANHSFVIVTSKVDLDALSDELLVVPTEQEAHDMIEMEEMERDLGL